MKRIGIVALAAALYCGPAAAQGGPDNLVQALLGPTGPVQGLTQSLQARSLQPLVDGLVSDTGLIGGGIAPQLNHALGGLLVDFRLGPVVNGAVGSALATTRALGDSLRGGGLRSLVIGPEALVTVPGLTYLPGGGFAGAGNRLALPGLEGGAGFSASQLREVNGLLGR